MSKASVIEHDDILFNRICGYLSETQRAIILSSNLIDAGAQLPVSIDFASILMTDSMVSGTFKVFVQLSTLQRSEIYRHLVNGYLRAW